LECKVAADLQSAKPFLRLGEAGKFTNLYATAEITLHNCFPNPALNIPLPAITA
jgi:hypothetical protein